MRPSRYRSAVHFVHPLRVFALAVAGALLRTWQEALVEQGRDGSAPPERVMDLTGGPTRGVPAPAGPLDATAGHSREGAS